VTVPEKIPVVVAYDNDLVTYEVDPDVEHVPVDGTQIEDPALPGLLLPVVPAVTGLDGADGAPVPAEFVAVTVKVYWIPFWSPSTTTLLVLADPVHPPGLDVAV
jgi:hypothetical protein